ncbi:hypothetical protein [Shumkonia mesophila]|uniref:hypothetical protein n=1 Tax=Shumkonia mesophila TaxID=2838854 RepID=UPI00293449E0|nr:hypothetical protein [Shumkonia mesophila]
MKFCYAMALLGSLVGTFFLIEALLGAKGAPQQAAAAAIGIAFAVLPYVFARCVEKMTGPSEVRIVN